MSTSRTDDLESRVLKETSRTSRRDKYTVPVAVSLFLVLYFILCGYIVVHGSAVLSTLESSEITTLYGP